MLQKNKSPGKERRKKYRCENIIGEDPKMLEIFRKIEDIGESSATVLIQGETGAGKDLIAEAIHYSSPRKKNPLIRVNCGALTENLVNSELFGHEKGAFTGAFSQKAGLFQVAEWGSIFLDEIGDISMVGQTSLLQVLESQTVTRVGGTSSFNIDTRVICATNRNLSEDIQKKSFREDLFYRINGITLHVPPLRERKSDIPLLANHFLEMYSNKAKKDITLIARESMDLLIRYNWPGNIRQLANVIRNSVVFCKGREIIPENLPEVVKDPSRSDPLTLKLTTRSLSRTESMLIRMVLEETSWNMAHAARELDIARTTLYSKIKRYGITNPQCNDGFCTPPVVPGSGGRRA